MIEHEKFTPAEAAALLKLGEQLQKLKKNSKQTLTPGEHQVDFSLNVKGTVIHAEGTQVCETWVLLNYLKAAIIRYADSIEDGNEWLCRLFDKDGYFGDAIKNGPHSVLANATPSLVSLWDTLDLEGKNLFQKITPKKTRSGETRAQLQANRDNLKPKKPTNKRIK